MARIDRNPLYPHGGFIGHPHTRDRKKRQSEHAWWTALNKLEELKKASAQTLEELEGVKTWAKQHGGITVW